MNAVAVKDGVGTAEQLAEQHMALIGAGQTFELRILKARSGTGRTHTESGFYGSASLVKFFCDALRHSGKALGAYWTPNALNPDLRSRRCDRLDWAETGELAKDGDVVRRRYLLIDVDPVRISGISSTDAEKAIAMEMAIAIREHFRELNWPDPVYADSGNGAHLMYRVDLPAEDAGLLERCLHAIANRFDNDLVKVDQTVFNASRIWKLYGTMACKGDNTKERPHRLAKLVDVPRDITKPEGIVSREQLEVLELEAPKTEYKTPVHRQSPAKNGTTRGYSSRLLVDRWLTDRGIAFRLKPEPEAEGRTVYVLECCPFNPSHGAPDSCVMQAPNGELSAFCFHNGCKGNGWKEFKERIGPPDNHHYDPPLAKQAAAGNQRNGDAPCRDVTLSKDEDAKSRPAGWQYAPIDSSVFSINDYRPRWLVKRLFVANQPAIAGGPKKALKTGTMLDLAISLASATPFLGEFAVYQKTRVAVLSGESGGFTLQETARRICRSKGIDLADLGDRLLWQFDLPQLANLSHMVTLTEGLRTAGVEVLIFDPLYLALLAGQGPNGARPEDLFSMGPLLLNVTRACLDVGCTPILIHHTRKHTGKETDALELDDLAYAGVAEFARQWFLISRRERFEPGTGLHRLWLSVGGSCGQSGLWSVDIDEGQLDEHFGGRKWDVKVTTASECREAASSQKQSERANAKERRDKDDETCVLRLLDQKNPAGDGYGRQKLVDLADCSKDRAVKAITRLVEDGILDEINDFKNKAGHGNTQTVKGIKRRPRA